MASTFTSPQVAAGVQPIVPVGNVETVAYGEYALTGALVVNDVIQIVRVPAGAIITGGFLAVDDLDTNGTPLITMQVGDGGSAPRFLASNTKPQTGGVAYFDAQAGFGFTYTVDDTIDVTVNTAPATGATTGTVRVGVRYKMSKP